MMKIERHWTDQASGITHDVTVEAYLHAACGQLHYTAPVLTHCGLDVDAELTVTPATNCVACLQADWLDALGASLDAEPAYSEPVPREDGGSQ